MNGQGRWHIAAWAALLSATPLVAQEPRPRTGLREPVLRVAERVDGSKKTLETTAPKPAAPKLTAPKSATPSAPSIPATPTSTTSPTPRPAPAPAGQTAATFPQILELARTGLEQMRRNVRDYSCVIAKRELVNSQLGDYEFMIAKVRHRRSEGGRVVVPFSVYLQFQKPDNLRGREVIFVEGRNDGKLIVHEGGLRGRLLPTLRIDPNGPVALRNNRYPISDIGIENLLVKLLERGERDSELAQCRVELRGGARMNDRACTVIELKHTTRRPNADFYMAQIFMDDELRLPIRYAAFDWPAVSGGEAPPLEEYSYMHLKTNVGLTDLDFDTSNPAYSF